MGDGWIGWLLLLYPKTYIDSDFGPLLNLWFQFAGIFIFGVVAVHLVEFCRRQVKAFCSWAGEIDIDLLDIERYQVFTIQPLRYLLITVIFISANVIVFRILSFTNPTFGLLAIQLPLMFAMLAFAYYVAKPIIILRSKIKQAKAHEIDVIRKALAGDRNKLQESQIAHVAAEFAAPDLMIYEQRIQSIWEWPIQGKVQRIALYVLLPPLAWVLAALVERVIDAVL